MLNYFPTQFLFGFDLCSLFLVRLLEFISVMNYFYDCAHSPPSLLVYILCEFNRVDHNLFAQLNDWVRLIFLCLNLLFPTSLSTLEYVCDCDIMCLNEN